MLDNFLKFYVFPIISVYFSVFEIYAHICLFKDIDTIQT